MVSGTEEQHILTDFLTVSQAASEVKVTRQYIHSILDKFTVYHLGNETGPIVILRVELEAWMKDRKKN